MKNSHIIKSILRNASFNQSFVKNSIIKDHNFRFLYESQESLYSPYKSKTYQCSNCNAWMYCGYLVIFNPRLSRELKYDTTEFEKFVSCEENIIRSIIV